MLCRRLVICYTEDYTMLPTITIDDIKHVATLSKIAVTDEQVQRLQTELAAILGYIKQLDAVDTAGVEPTYQVTGLRNVTRADELIEYQVSREELLANVPKRQDNQIKVPKVL